MSPKVSSSVVVSLLVAACSPSSPGSPQQSAPAASVRRAPSSAPPPSAPPSSAAPTQAADDRGAVVQAVIDHPQVSQYFHAGVPGRLPLRVAERGLLPHHPALVFAGERVVYVEADDERAFVLDALDPAGGEATLSAHYPREGVVVHADLERAAGAWRVVRINANELAQGAQGTTATPAFRNPDSLPRAWVDCSKATCTMVRNECCDAWSVVEGHREEAQREMNARRSKAMVGVRPGASPCRRSCADPGTPVCAAGVCSFAK